MVVSLDGNNKIRRHILLAGIGREVMAENEKDVFICHAREDKPSVIRPLIEALKAAHISYWLDEVEIKWGASITEKVNEGLTRSRYVMVVLSRAFITKHWPKRELNSMLNIEASSGEVKILPLLVGTEEEKNSILRELPLLNDKLYLTWNNNAQEIVNHLSACLSRSEGVETSGIMPSAASPPAISCSSDQPLILPAKSKPPDWLRYKLIVFDLDGTLLKGYKFSWTLVWRYLGFPREVQDEGIRRYRKGIYDYTQWCDWSCKLFIDKNLRREAFREITRDVYLTKNFYETLRILKSEGILTAIVSGGIDTFIHEKIPDVEQWFDYVLINKFVFDEYGRLAKIVTTDYDFAGKAEALKLICEANGFGPNESVFVGEGYNDESAACTAGLCIAYPPASDGLDVVAHVRIDDDDLSLILPHILKT